MIRNHPQRNFNADIAYDRIPSYSTNVSMAIFEPDNEHFQMHGREKPSYLTGRCSQFDNIVNRTDFSGADRYSAS